jgi:hypothetical protein
MEGGKMNGSNRRNPGIFGLVLILTLVALYALILAILGEASSSAAHPSLLASLRVVAPVSTGVNCGSCHCDPRGASTEYPANSTSNVIPNTLTLQDFVKESQYVPLLVRQDTVFCASDHAGLPGDEEDNVIDLMRPQGQPGT